VKPLRERFEGKYRVDPSGCWIWIAGGDKYGTLNVGNGKMCGAHRVSYLLHHGPIPDGMMVCHRCDVPRCVNPEHLFLGGASDNLRDCYSKGRSPLQRRDPRGERNGNAKLTQDDVDFIRFATATMPMSQKEVARAFGVKRHTIYLITAGKNWPQEQAT